MKKLFTVLTTALTLAGMSTYVGAQAAPCGAVEPTLSMLKEQYGEEPIFLTEVPAGVFMVLTNDETRTWSLIVIDLVNGDPKACLLQSGNKFKRPDVDAE